MRKRGILLALILLIPLALGGCTTVDKKDGIFHAKGIAFKLFGFSIPRTDFETVGDAVTRQVGANANITNLWKSATFRPWYNVLNPLIGVEIIEIYGTY